MEMLEYLIIEIEPSFEPGERFVLFPVEGENAGPIKYMLRYEYTVGEKSDEKTKREVHLAQAQADDESESCAIRECSQSEGAAVP